LGSGTASHFQKDAGYTVPPGSWARYDAVDFGSTSDEGNNSSGSYHLSVSAVVARDAQGNGARVLFRLGSPEADAPLLAELTIPSDIGGGSSFQLVNGTPGTATSPTGIHVVFMVFDTPPPSPPPPQPDNKPHRFWRITAGPSDFNTSFYNPLWDVCELELRNAPWPAGPNLAVDPSHAIQSSGDGSKAFDGIANCTQWDGCTGCTFDGWRPASDPHNHQWVGYDFGATPQRITEVRLA
jgi:hypothetical protein